MPKLTFESILSEKSPTAALNIPEKEKQGSQFAENEQNKSGTDQYMS